MYFSVFEIFFQLNWTVFCGGVKLIFDRDGEVDGSDSEVERRAVTVGRSILRERKDIVFGMIIRILLGATTAI